MERDLIVSGINPTDHLSPGTIIAGALADRDPRTGPFLSPYMGGVNRAFPQPVLQRAITIHPFYSPYALVSRLLEGLSALLYFRSCRQPHS